jgi:hypothetical protein
VDVAMVENRGDSNRLTGNRVSGVENRYEIVNIEKNHETWRRKTEKFAMDLFEDVDELKELMDKLILQTLELVEEDVTLKINIEKLTNEGALLMAKTR